MTTLTKVRSGLDQANAAVGAAQTLLEQGRVIDLSGLETHVETLCSDIGTLPPEDRTTLKTSLVTLIDELNRLAADIESRNRVITEELHDNGARQRAVTAYGSGGPKGGNR